MIREGPEAVPYESSYDAIAYGVIDLSSRRYRASFYIHQLTLENPIGGALTDQPVV